MMTMTEVDGVRVLTAPTTGPARGGIMFRVGYHDEPFGARGVTHLIEHLALFRLGMTDFHYNGATAPNTTHFFSQGTPESVGAYITGVCHALTDLPLDRLETEKQVLDTEAKGRGNSLGTLMDTWRYGARGTMTEWGLPTLTGPMLNDWVRHYFTRENAVIWFAGDQLPDLGSLGLPSGVPQPVPAMKNLVASYPGFFHQAPNSIGWQAIVTRSTAASVYADVLKRQLFHDLRQDNGYSYTVDTDYSPIDAEHAALSGFADIANDLAGATLGGFVDVLARLRWGSIDAETVDAARSQYRQGLDQPDYDALKLPSDCDNLLLGKPLLTRDEALSELAQVDEAALHRVAEEAAATMLLAVPVGYSGSWAGYTQVPTQEEPVVGPGFVPVDGSEVRLIVTHDGVTFKNGDNLTTVRFAHCAGMLAWPDGARQLVSGDAMSIKIEPTLWRIDPQTLAQIDRAIPRELVVWQPARRPDQIPVATPAPVTQDQPASTQAGKPAKAPAPVRPAAPKGVTALLVVWIVLLVITVLWTLAIVAANADQPGNIGGVIAIVVPPWIVTAWVFTVWLRRSKAWKHSLEQG